MKWKIILIFTILTAALHTAVGMLAIASGVESLTALRLEYIIKFLAFIAICFYLEKKRYRSVLVCALGLSIVPMVSINNAISFSNLEDMTITTLSVGYPSILLAIVSIWLFDVGLQLATFFKKLSNKATQSERQKKCSVR